MANDGPPLADVTVLVTLAGETALLSLGALRGWSATAARPVDLPVPGVPGPHEVALPLVSGDREIASSVYPLRAVTPGALGPVDNPTPPSPRGVTLLVGAPITGGRGSGAPGRRRSGSGAAAGGSNADEGGRVFHPAPGLMVVGEGALDAEVGEQVRERLAAGGGAVAVLAQDGEAAAYHAVAVEIAEVGDGVGVDGVPLRL